ncbi:hypothetical protein ACYPKM_01070 [Pseudomonas aeruginosa]
MNYESQVEAMQSAEHLQPPGTVLYNFRDERHQRTYGPYAGEPNLDLGWHQQRYREACYAAAEAIGADGCDISTEDFLSWMVGEEILVQIPAKTESLDVHPESGAPYVPKHWPLCPQCGIGRGGEQLQSENAVFNRVTYARACTSCDHKWDFVDYARVPGHPMLEDDGSTTEDACAPYSLAKATGLPYAKVLEECIRCGWENPGGMKMISAFIALKNLGFEHDEVYMPRDGVLTLSSAVKTLPTYGSYLISVNEHLMAFVEGQLFDMGDVHGRCQVHGIWEVEAGA